MFRGSAPAKIDDKGRLKVPTEFRRTFEERWGLDVYITSVRGEQVFIYPLAVWEEHEAQVAALPRADPVRRRFLARSAYFGQEAALDAQGRVVLPPLVRAAADLDVGAEVVVSAMVDHLEVWNHERLQKLFADEPFTDDDFRYLSERGV